MNPFSVEGPLQGVFTLHGDLDRSNVNEIWPACVDDIKRAAGKSDAVVLDMRHIAHTDTAGLAWLINLIRDCHRQNIHFTLHKVPQTLINLAKISDVDAYLPLQ